jgi:SAM-dependent methyltransferase
VVSLNRVVMHHSSRRLIGRLNPATLDAAEISGRFGKRFAFKSYTQFGNPTDDICAGPFIDPKTVRQFDLILANQVWGHLNRPYTALAHMQQTLRAGGYFWIAVPFFIPFHAAPNDNSRWSARGLKNLLIEAGFDESRVIARQWGNRAAAARNLEPDWPPSFDKNTDDLTNDPKMPLCAWALAQKS